MKTWVGTSGFQYPEWKGGFYPADLSAAKMLAYYGERFASTEVNYSFRRIPSASTLEKWDAATPAEFRFSFKAPQRITHFAKLQGCEEILGVFAEALAAIGPKLGVVLFQLPPTFRKDAARLRDFLPILPAGLRAAFEFRDASWFDEEIFGALSARNVALCVAESSELATPRVATADFGYLRLRREDYTKREIADWAKWGRAQRWAEAFVYFKHEARGVGPTFAAQFVEVDGR